MKNLYSYLLSFFFACNASQEADSAKAATAKPAVIEQSSEQVQQEQKQQLIEDDLKVMPELRPMFKKYHNEPHDDYKIEERLTQLITLLHLNRILDIETKLKEQLEQDTKELKELQSANGWAFASEKYAHKSDSEKEILSNAGSRYLLNLEKYRKLLKQHAPFLQGHKIINFYAQMPEEVQDMCAWIRNDRLKDEELPFARYRMLSKEHLSTIDLLLLHKDKYPQMTERLLQVRERITSSLHMIEDQYQEEKSNKEKADREKEEFAESLRVAEFDRKQKEDARKLDEKERLENLENSKKLTAIQAALLDTQKQELIRADEFRKKMSSLLSDLNTIDWRQSENIDEKKLTERVNKISELEQKSRAFKEDIPHIEQTLKYMKAKTKFISDYKKAKSRLDELEVTIANHERKSKELDDAIKAEMQAQGAHAPLNIVDVQAQQSICKRIIQDAKKEHRDLGRQIENMESIDRQLDDIRKVYEQAVPRSEQQKTSWW